MEVRTALIKYIFLDIVGYSVGRTVEAQTEIINVLNNIVQNAVNAQNIEKEKIIYLPTGDGMCICLINIIDPYDIHIKIALNILEQIFIRNEKQQDGQRVFKIRIGINENHDNIVIDINNRDNIAGAGINIAQRIMAMAEDSQIYMGQSVYEKLVQRELYSKCFRVETAIIKHGINYTCYQYINKELSYLNNEDQNEETGDKL
jgi:class 3 adenylate cyclase